MADNLILIVDDEKHIVELASLYLKNEGFSVETAYSGEEALRQFRRLSPNLIILDLMLPEIDGLEVCKRIRKDSNVPIIMLTARGEDIDKILGLELGADDYMLKPFNPRELVARVKAVLRRLGSGVAKEQKSAGIVRLGNTTLDLDRYELRVKNELIELRAKELELLRVLAQHEGIVLERDRLLNMVWGYEYYGDTRTVDVHIAHLRERLEGSDAQIQTVRGVGYKLVVSS